MKPRPQCSTLFPYTTLFRSVIKQWLQWLKTDRMGEFTWDTMVKTYRLAGRVNWLKPLAVPLLVVLAQPRYGKERIINLLEELLQQDTSEYLQQINCPTMIFAGAQDPILGPELQAEMAALIQDSELYLADGYLHGADLDSPEYRTRFEEFMRTRAKTSPETE